MILLCTRGTNDPQLTNLLVVQVLSALQDDFNLDHLYSYRQVGGRFAEFGEAFEDLLFKGSAVVVHSLLQVPARRLWAVHHSVGCAHRPPNSSWSPGLSG